MQDTFVKAGRNFFQGFIGSDRVIEGIAILYFKQREQDSTVFRQGVEQWAQALRARSDLSIEPAREHLKAYSQNIGNALFFLSGVHHAFQERAPVLEMLSLRHFLLYQKTTQPLQFAPNIITACSHSVNVNLHATLSALRFQQFYFCLSPVQIKIEKNPLLAENSKASMASTLRTEYHTARTTNFPREFDVLGKGMAIDHVQ